VNKIQTGRTFRIEWIRNCNLFFNKFDRIELNLQNIKYHFYFIQFLI